MTEAEWLACDDLMRMISFVGRQVSERKLRLFAAEAFRRLAHHLPDDRQQRAIVALERLAEGTATKADRSQACRETRLAIQPRNHPYDTAEVIGLLLFREFASSSPGVHAAHAITFLAHADDAIGQGHAVMLRDIVGNPFHASSIDPSWLVWGDGTVQKIAQAGYDEQAFDRLPILADALEEAGCADAALLAHLRSPGPHVRGCWALDLILGKS